MTNPTMILVLYHELELHPILDAEHGWLLSESEVLHAYRIDALRLDALLQTHADTLIETQHYLYRSFEYAGQHSPHLRLWTKSGVMRLAYYLQSDDALAFLDFIQGLHLSVPTSTSPQTLTRDIEHYLQERLQALRAQEEAPLEEVQALIQTVQQLQRPSSPAQTPALEPTNIERVVTIVMKLLNSEATAQLLERLLAPKPASSTEPASPPDLNFKL